MLFLCPTSCLLTLILSKLHSNLTFVALLNILFPFLWFCKKYVINSAVIVHSTLIFYTIDIPPYLPFTFSHIYFLFCVYFKSKTYVPIFSQFSPWAWNMWWTGIYLIIMCNILSFGFTMHPKEARTTGVQHNHQLMIGIFFTLLKSFFASIQDEFWHLVIFQSFKFVMVSGSIWPSIGPDF